MSLLELAPLPRGSVRSLPKKLSVVYSEELYSSREKRLHEGVQEGVLCGTR